MEAVITRIIPVISLLFLGFLIQKKNLISRETVGDLKLIIINLALPSVLFFAFVSAELNRQYLLLFILVFLYCLALYGAGLVLRRFRPYRARFTPGYITGFEFGMVGVAFFGGIFGLDKLSVITLIGFGHELFIWFVYVPLLGSLKGESFHLGNTLKSFMKSPIILAILSAVVLNLSGLYSLFSSQYIVAGFLESLRILSGMTMPLILIVVGYGLVFEHLEWKKSLSFVAVRAVLVGVSGTLVYLLLGVLGLTRAPLFGWAFLTFIMLPPPYILPVYMPGSEKNEADFFTGALVLYTLVSLVTYLVLIVALRPVF